MNKHTRRRTHAQLDALEVKRIRRQRLRALQRLIGREVLRPVRERPLSQSERVAAHLSGVLDQFRKVLGGMSGSGGVSQR